MLGFLSYKLSQPRCTMILVLSAFSKQPFTRVFTCEARKKRTRFGSVTPWERRWAPFVYVTSLILFAYYVLIIGLRFDLGFGLCSGRRSVWGGWRGSAERWDRDPSSAFIFRQSILVLFFFRCLCCQMGLPVVNGAAFSRLMFWYLISVCYNLY